MYIVIYESGGQLGAALELDDVKNPSTVAQEHNGALLQKVHFDASNSPTPLIKDVILSMPPERLLENIYISCFVLLRVSHSKKESLRA